MRRIAFALCLAVSVPAGARSRHVSREVAPPVEHDFWGDVLEPHGREVAIILRKVNEAWSMVQSTSSGDYDPTGQQSLRYLRDAYGMLRYARKLAPDNVEVLTFLGKIADLLGKTPEALDAFKTAVDVAGADKVSAEYVGWLGAIYLRLGQTDDAIRYLKVAQGDGGRGGPEWIAVQLADALTTKGDVDAAIDVLASASTSTNPYYQAPILVTFALAVVYDRDDQRGAAFDVLDRLQSTLSTQFSMDVQSALSNWRPAVPEDKHYYQALLYEIGGSYTEARAEWMLYAEADLPYRARALDHVAAIDELRRKAPPAAKKPPEPPVTPPIPYRRHRP